MEATRGGCSITYTIGECEDHRATSFSDTKFTGSCPGEGEEQGEDEPCFSREAEACRILDTSTTPSVAFHACFDEAQPMPMAAERVKMTALTGGDYVLSAGKDQAYEFTRIIVNQHKLNEARNAYTTHHHAPLSGCCIHPARSPPSHPTPTPPQTVRYPRVQKRSSILKIAHANGEIELTPDHVLLVDGQWAAAHTVKVAPTHDEALLSRSLITPPLPPLSYTPTRHPPALPAYEPLTL